MWNDFDLWKLLAGLGIFLFGMFLLEESVKKLGGRAFKKLIRRYTSGKVRSIGSGLLATSLLQSSSAVSLMVLAFVGAGVLSMENAIGVVLGSNIGTTITSWLVATIGFKINIESFSLPLIGIGGLGLIFLGQSEKYSNISKLLVGFGFLFMGLDYMKTSVEGFTRQFDISSIPAYGRIVYLGAGILLTVIMQSSSATMALLLTALNAGIISFESAASMVIGGNVGTTVTVLLGAIGAVQVKKRVAFSHFIFNFVTALIAFVIMPVLIHMIIEMIDLKRDPMVGLALFHTLFNAVGVLIFIPLINPMANLLIRFFPEKKTQLALYVDSATADIPEAAISVLKKEIIHLTFQVMRHNARVLRVKESFIFSGKPFPEEEDNKFRTSLFDPKYDNLKLLQSKIITFAAAIQAHALTAEETNELNRLMLAARMALHSAKALKDIRHNLDEFENADNAFLYEKHTDFRNRLKDTYAGLDTILTQTEREALSKELLKMLRQLQKSDSEFIRTLIDAVNRKKIKDLDVSNALVANRAFFQSSKQIVLAIRQLLLTEEELKQFENLQDIMLEF